MKGQEFDERFMLRALALAERGRGRTSPNPVVGAVVVRHGRIVGEGFHAVCGGPHAEAVALRRAGRRARGATLYVTLEPCAHQGRTPPCTEGIIRAGVREVVAAIRDPHRIVAGRGFAALRRKGIKVRVGVGRPEAERLNRPYLTWVRLKRPWIAVKWASSVDGKLATAAGESRWISGSAARRWVHRWRAEADAVVVGGRTVRRDNPALLPASVRVVVSVTGKLPIRAKIFSPGAPTLVVVPPGVKRAVQARLAPRGVEVWAGRAARGGRGVDARWLARAFGRRGWTSVLVEAGGAFNAALFEAGLVDEVRAFVAPIALGGGRAPTGWDGRGVRSLSRAVRLSEVSVRRVGPDVLIQGVVAR